MKQSITSFIARLRKPTVTNPASHFNTQQSQLAFVIADISGYTEYIKSNAASTEHAHAVIAHLLEGIVNDMATPLVLNKFEGDAVLMFASITDENTGTMQIILDKSSALFESFDRRRRKLANNRQICPCDACVGIDKLRIKIIIHRGKAAIRKIFQFDEIAGPDVIRIHRLLKNQVESNQYLMITEQAVNGLSISPKHQGEWSIETHAHLGEINVWVYDAQKNR
jgi:hypothetical protein